MSLVYLKWSFLLLAVWLVIYWADAAGRRSLVTLGLGTMPFSLTEPLFVPSYWNPPTLFDLARRTGFDIESVIFAFSVGGIAGSLYKLLLRGHHEKVAAAQKHDGQHGLHRFALATPLAIFPLLYLIAGWNPIYAGIAAMAMGAVAAGLCRPDLWRQIAIGGLSFLLVYFVFFQTLISVNTGYVEAVWNLRALSGVVILGVPMEELLFAASLGMMWSGLYEHLTWTRWVRDGDK